MLSFVAPVYPLVMQVLCQGGVYMIDPATFHTVEAYAQHSFRQTTKSKTRCIRPKRQCRCSMSIVRTWHEEEPVENDS